jgi:hypothetical protein
MRTLQCGLEEAEIRVPEILSSVVRPVLQTESSGEQVGLLQCRQIFESTLGKRIKSVRRATFYQA